ncbi:LysR family transcriptional regulator [Pseudaestuariivita sp.]|uniref:LysR family transcriptional regulator n=1 Tax=Pseudaestuariivita sp. TaxID=2211669 RepID=UPI004057CE1F
MFVEAAERSSFAGAAEALNVTQAAVSKQMATLEDRLDVTLFERRHRSVEVTSAGRAYLPVARQVLDLLAAGRDGAVSRAERHHLTVEVDYEFLDFVLAPRLSDLWQALPDTDVTFIPAAPGRQMPRSDLAITFGRPRAGAVEEERLCGFTVFPVAHPGLVATCKAPLAELPLLHDFDTYWWERFLAEANVSRPDQGAILGNGALAIRAAMAGQGLAIGDDVLCAGALQSGALVRVGDMSFPGREAYWLSVHPGLRSTGAVAAFRDWVLTLVR